MQNLLIEMFYDVDNYCIYFEEYCKSYFLSNDNDESEFKFTSSKILCLSEIMTITIYFHLSGYRNFKNYYKEHVATVLKPYFPRLVSYNRFVELMQEALIPLLLSIKISEKPKHNILLILVSYHISPSSHLNIYREI